MVRSRSLIAVVVLVSVLPPVAVAQEEPGEPEPLDVGLVEQVERPLAQIHVTVSGPPQKLAALDRKDFRLWVRGVKVREFTVDRLSPPVGADGRPPVAGDEPGARPASHLFYFDQPLLKPFGRRRALDLARDLVPRLITAENRAMIVSNAKGVKVYAHLTSDVPELLAALDRIETDLEQLDSYAAGEDHRIASIFEAAAEARVAGGTVAGGLSRLNPSSQGRAALDEIRDHLKSERHGGFGSADDGSGGSVLSSDPQSLAAEYDNKRGTQRDALSGTLGEVESAARAFQRDESWRGVLALQRLRAVMAHLHFVEPPKSILYFADIFRLNPGQHYMNLFEGEDSPGISETASYFEDLLDDAAASGIRFFTVQAEGLVTYNAGMGVAHVRDAQEGLSSLAAHTGGRAFLNGVEASRIGESIAQDFSNTYLVSFDPTDLPRGKTLPVTVKVERPGVQVHHRGRLVLRTDEQRRVSRLLGAFAAPDSVKSDLFVRPVVIPTGYRDGNFTALVQVAVPGSESSATWDLGASVVARGRVREASSRMTVNTPGVPVVLQQEMTFTPGPFEIVAVAYDVNGDGIASRQVEGAWPKPDEAEAVVGPIAVLQPTRAAIRRQDEVRTSGAVAYTEEQAVRTDRPTAVVALVCKRRELKGPLVAERRLAGRTAVDFAATEMDLGKESCALIQDLIPAGTMTAGGFRYEIRILDDGRELARSERPFLAWTGEAR